MNFRFYQTSCQCQAPATSPRQSKRGDLTTRSVLLSQLKQQNWRQDLYDIGLRYRWFQFNMGAEGDEAWVKKQKHELKKKKKEVSAIYNLSLYNLYIIAESDVTESDVTES